MHTRRNPARQSAPTVRNENRPRVGQVLEDLQRNRAISCHDVVVGEGMDERARQPRVAMLGDHTPPGVERTLVNARAEAFDGFQLCRGRCVWYNYGAADA